MKRRWIIILCGSVLGGGLAQLALTSCATKATAATPTDCQSWAVGELSIPTTSAGPADPGVAKSSLVPAGWEPFSGWSQTDLVYIRKCVQ
jgi:hypothetical protein